MNHSVKGTFGKAYKFFRRRLIWLYAKHRGYGDKMAPPESIRYCLGCQKNTIWKYNKTVGHSRCTECGGMYSTKEQIPNEVLDNVAKNLMPWIK